jgi:hypothetical protein
MAEDAVKPVSKEKVAGVSANHKPNGDFAKGNTAGVKTTNREHSRAMEFKKIFQSAITDQDMLDIAKAMLTKAKTGDVKAAQEVLNRCMGKPEQPVNLEHTGNITVEIVGYGNREQNKTTLQV